MFYPRGIIPAMVTPLDENEKLDESALRRLVRYLIEGGAHALFVLGSQGEFWAFDVVEKKEIFTIVVDEVAGRIPVLGGTTAVTTREALELTHVAAEAGVDAVSVLTPFFVSPNQAEIIAHFQAISESTSLPVLLYNNPGRTGVHLEPHTVARLAEIPNIVGIKDSSGDLARTSEYVAVTPDSFAVLMGRDTLILAGLVTGCAGAVAATANVVPRLVVQIYDRFLSGDLEGARRAQERLAPLRQAFRLGTFPVVVKEAVDLIGLAAGPARRPVGRISQDARQELARVLRDLQCGEES